MRTLALTIVLGLSLLSATAAAQVAPSEPGGGSPDATVAGSLSDLPAALQVPVLRSSAGSGHRGHRILRFHSSAPFEATVQRLRDWEEKSREFGGGYRFIGWAHQFQGDMWWYTLLTPRGEQLLLRVERDPAGCLLSIDTHGQTGPEMRSRRSYRQGDAGPRP